MSRTIFLLTIAFLLSVSVPFSSSAAEDPVIVSINQAAQNYKAGKFSTAIANLEYAGQIIRQKKGEALEKLLPGPLNGWIAKQSGSKITKTALFDGATTAERHYIKKDSTVTVRFSSDSPMMQSMTMRFSNPIFASSAGQQEIINGHKAVIDFKEKSGTVNIVIGNNLLVTVEGNNVKKEDLLLYADKIDMNKLAKLP